MLTPIEIVSITGGLFGVLFGFASWRRGDHADAERLGVIETKLESIIDDLKVLIGKLDRSDERFNTIEQRIAKLEEQVKTCFSMIKKE